jgi:hypothetical protein
VQIRINHRGVTKRTRVRAFAAAEASVWCGGNLRPSAPEGLCMYARAETFAQHCLEGTQFGRPVGASGVRTWRRFRRSAFLKIFMAYTSPLALCFTCITFPNPPRPNTFQIKKKGERIFNKSGESAQL